MTDRVCAWKGRAIQEMTRAELEAAFIELVDENRLLQHYEICGQMENESLRQSLIAANR